MENKIIVYVLIGISIALMIINLGSIIFPGKTYCIQSYDLGNDWDKMYLLVDCEDLDENLKDCIKPEKIDGWWTKVDCPEYEYKFYPELPDFATTENGILVNYSVGNFAISPSGIFYFYNGSEIYAYKLAYVLKD